jgi:hypothetical protein
MWPCGHNNLYSGSSHKTQNMCSRIMMINYKNTPFKPHKKKKHVMEDINWFPVKNKWSTINNTTIYAFNNASKDNVNPCEIIIYYTSIPTLINNLKWITSKLNTFTIHDVMMRAFKWSIIILKKNFANIPILAN